MKKKNKFGLNTGNSFSFGSYATRPQLNSKDDQVVVKTLENNYIQLSNSEELNNRILIRANDLIHDGGLEGNMYYKHRDRSNFRCDMNVTYSVNKRKRWDLKELIMSAIQDSSDEKDNLEDKDQFAISLTERKFSGNSYCRSLLRHDCIGYHNSHALIPHVYPVGVTSFETALTKKAWQISNKDIRQENRQRRKRLHNQHFRDLQRKLKREKPKINSTNQNDDPNDQLHQLYRNHRTRREQKSAIYPNNIPDVHYEICSSRPLFAYSGNYDENQKNRWFYSYQDYCKDPKKSKKKRKHYKNKAYPPYDYRVYELKHSWKEDLVNFSNNKTTGLEDNSIFSKESLTFSGDCNHDISASNSVYKIISSTDNSNCCSKEYTLVEQYMENDYDSDNDYDSELKSTFTANHMSVDFNEIMCQAKNKSNANNVVHSKRKRKSRIKQKQTNCGVATSASSHVVNRHGKSEVIFYKSYKPLTIDKPKFIAKTFNDQSEFDPNKQLLPHITDVYVTSFAINSSIHPKHLEHVYGESYTEGFSSPRLFSINISNYSLNIQAINSKVYMVVRLCPEEVNSDAMKVYGVECSPICIYVKGNFDDQLTANIQHELEENMLENNVFNMYDITTGVINSLLKTTKHLQGTDEQIEHLMKIPRISHAYSFRQLHSLRAWDVKSHDLSETFNIVQDLPLVHHKVQMKKLCSISCVTSTSQQEVCEICYMTIHTTYSGTGTALLSCKHWFCNICWIVYITQAIDSGISFLECPAFECDSRVDDITILSLVNYPMYRKQWLHLQNAKIERLPEWKWCPRLNCGRTVSVDANHSDLSRQDPSELYVCIECACHHKWCFDCQQEPHWPVSCKVAGNYTKLVFQRNVSNAGEDKIHFIEVKKCPNCKYPLSKEIGCQHMVCKCGFNFCWECLGAWHAHGGTLTCPKEFVQLSKVRLEDFSNFELSEHYVNKAVQLKKQKAIILKRNKCNIKKYFVPKHNTNSGGGLERQDDEYIQKLEDIGLYIFMMCHTLEFCYALSSQTKPRLNKTLVDKLSILELHYHGLFKIVYHDVGRIHDHHLVQFMEKQKQINLLINKIAAQVDRIQKKL